MIDLWQHIRLRKLAEKVKFTPLLLRVQKLQEGTQTRVDFTQRKAAHVFLRLPLLHEVQDAYRSTAD